MLYTGLTNVLLYVNGILYHESAENSESSGGIFVLIEVQRLELLWILTVSMFIQIKRFIRG